MRTRTRAFLVALLLVPIAATTVATAGIRAEVTIPLATSTNTIPILSKGRLFGSFFEEFLHAGEGGIYAEKIANRALHQSDDGWIVVAGDVRRDAVHPLNNITRHALWLVPTLDQPAIVQNAGFPGGMAVSTGEELRLSLFVFVDAHPPAVTLRASLIANQTVLATASLAMPPTVTPGQWRKLQAKLVVIDPRSGHRAIPCRFQLEAGLSQPGNLQLGATVISLVSKTATWKRQGLLRRDVMTWLNESRPPFLRTPGGCFVQGRHWGGEWDWRRTLGPPQDRPGHYNDRWGYFTSDGLGLLEYLLMAHQMGAKPLLVVQAGCTMTDCRTNPTDVDYYVRSALDAVEFVLGDPVQTQWGAKRAAAGHPTPFALEALGIGNENCRPHQLRPYARNFLHIARAVRRRYPHLPLVLGCESPEQMRSVLQVEPGIANLTNLLYDVHQRHGSQSFLRHAHYFDSLPRGTRAAAAGPTIFVSEYSSPREEFPDGVDLGGAVAEAIYMMGMEANADVVRWATYGDLIANRHDLHDRDHRAAGISTILLDARGSFGTPSWVVQTLFLRNQPHALLKGVHFSNVVVQNNRSVPVEPWRNGGTASYLEDGTDGVGMLAISVSLAGNGGIVVKLANYGHEHAIVSIQIKDWRGRLSDEAILDWIASSDGPTAKNSMDNPRYVGIQRELVPVNIEGGLVTVRIQAFSVTVLSLLPRKPNSVAQGTQVDSERED